MAEAKYAEQRARRIARIALKAKKAAEKAAAEKARQPEPPQHAFSNITIVEEGTEGVEAKEVIAIERMAPAVYRPIPGRARTSSNDSGNTPR